MDKKRIEIIATFIMALVLIMAWMNSFKVMRKRSVPVVASVSAAPQEGTGKLTQPQQPPEKKDKPKEVITRWGRDPFSGKAYSTASRAEGLGDLKVEGVIWDKKNPLAMINGRVLKKGDNFKGNVVVDIKENSVILSDGNRDIELKVGK